ncbi:MAG: hypothetical protein CFH41_02842 [Alphaproteobacteria bacterium MarineAlpha11_Bin1]|nr:MAG: hypothetical protein CFH41_02842 [Alphaproteobacteria bacterium MarineAlpha11_Bin1]|tara:strand:- start:9978 stop:10463 length:486 start_codon:yes stop_codon:yes gene_type:complete
MEVWFTKSILATLCIVPSFIAIPFMKFRFGVDPLVFLAWYFGATAISIVVYLSLSGRSGEILPQSPVLAIILLIGAVFGALANGSLFQAIGLAPNPGLPPVMYATSSMLVFFLSVVLAGTFPALFKPVVADFGRIVGICFVLAGLYLLAGGKIAGLFRAGG